MYMLGSEHGSVPSMDCTAQSIDLHVCFEQQSIDCLLNLWTSHTEVHKTWIWAIHGLTWTKHGFAIAVVSRVKVHGFHEKARGRT